MPGNEQQKLKERLKKRKQRQRIKDDATKFEEYKRKERERKREKRKEIKEFLEQHPKLKKKAREEKKLQMRAYRAKKAAENVGEGVIENKRSQASKIRENKRKDKRRKSEERLQKKLTEAARKKALATTKLWRMKIKLQDEDESLAESNFPSPSAEKRATRKAKTNLPKTPQKKAAVIASLIKSPRTRNILEKKGVVMSKKAQKQLEMGEDVIESLSEKVEDLRSRSPATAQKTHAMKILKSVVAQTKESRRALCSRLKLKQRKLSKKESVKWWQPNARKKRQDGLSNQTKQRVQEFYLSPDVSREVPDKRAAIKVKENNKVRIVQRHNMTMTLADAHSVYQKLYPDDRIGLTSFTKLRPLQVKKVSETSRRTCLCQACCNAALKAEALKKFCAELHAKPEVLTAKQAVVDATICEYDEHPKAACLKRECKDCGPCRLFERYAGIVAGNEDKEITWHVWGPLTLQKSGTKPKRVISCLTKSTPLREFMTEYKKDLQTLPNHIFRSQWQHRQMKICVDHLSKDEACLCMDYAENYQCCFQGEVQSAFFEQNSITIHPMMAYYTQELEGKFVQVKHAIIGITDDQDKDACGVKAFEDAAIETIQDGMATQLKVLHEFTDGCAAQYKGRKAFLDISHRNAPKVVRNFFETSHGKSVCDGLGAVVKSSCYHAVISGRAIVKDADDFMNYCVKNLSVPLKHMASPDGTKYLSKRQFIFLKRDNVNRIRPKFSLSQAHVKSTASGAQDKTSHWSPETSDATVQCAKQGRNLVRMRNMWQSGRTKQYDWTRRQLTIIQPRKQCNVFF